MKKRYKNKYTPVQKDCTKYVALGMAIGIVLSALVFLTVVGVASAEDATGTKMFVATQEYGEEGRLAIREKPSLKGDLVGWLLKGDEVMVAFEKNGWSKLVNLGTEASEGWCASKYLSSVDPKSECSVELLFTVEED